MFLFSSTGILLLLLLLHLLQPEAVKNFPAQCQDLSREREVGKHPLDSSREFSRSCTEQGVILDWALQEFLAKGALQKGLCPSCLVFLPKRLKGAQNQDWEHRDVIPEDALVGLFQLGIFPVSMGHNWIQQGSTPGISQLHFCIYLRG